MRLFKSNKILSFFESKEHRLDPFPWYEEMRESSPVYFDGRLDAWNVFRYDDVSTILSDYSQYSSRGEGRDPLLQSMIKADPPKHEWLRAFLTGAFSPSSIASLEPKIWEIANGLIDRVLPDGKMDVVKDLSAALPNAVIGDMLGIPTDDRQKLKRLSDAYLKIDDAHGNGSSDDLHPKRVLAEYFAELIERRRGDNGTDLISKLIAAEVDGRKLSKEELVGACSLLLVAGLETTTNLITNAVRVLVERKDVWTSLKKEPELVLTAAEEVLRFYSPDQVRPRTAAKKATVRGKTIGSGQTVLAWLGSANRDESKFKNASSFDLRRRPNPHLAFGTNIHFCIGAPLARLEAKIAIRTMLKQFEEINGFPGAQLEPWDNFRYFGLKHLAVRFSSAKP